MAPHKTECQHPLTPNASVIQLAKLSGFSPIIATCSQQHEEYVKSLGATHVIDRKTDLTSLSATVASITSEAIEFIYDSVAVADTQKAAYDLVAPGGTLLLTLHSVLENADKGNKHVNWVYGSPHPPAQREMGSKMCLALSGYLADGSIKVCDQPFSLGEEC